MFHLLRMVHERLNRASVPHALIGAGAMSVVGYVRATQDLDFLAVDPAVLDSAFWSCLSSPVVVEVFDGRMDGSDPLAGVVRLEDESTTEQVDVVVGKDTRWQMPILSRAMPVALSDTVTIPVAEGAESRSSGCVDGVVDAALERLKTAEQLSVAGSDHLLREGRLLAIRA